MLDDNRVCVEFVCVGGGGRCKWRKVVVGYIKVFTMAKKKDT